MTEKVVKISAYLARRAQSDSDIQTGYLGRLLGQENGLQIEGGAQILLHEPLSFPDFLIETGIFNRNRH